MPQLPGVQYVAQNAPRGVIGAANRPAAPDVSGLVRGVTSYQDSMDRLADFNERRRLQLDEDEAKTAVSNTLSEARAKWSQRILEAKNSASDGAAGFTQGLLKEYDAWAEKTTTQASDLARPILQERIKALRGTVNEHAFEYEMQARNTKVVSDFSVGLDADRRAVMSDPNQFAEALASRTALARSLSVPPQDRDKMVNAARESLAYAAGSTLVERDPQGWLARDATKDPVKSLMDPRQLESLDAHAKAAIARAQSAAQSGRDEAVKAAAAALEDLQKFVIDGGQVSPEYEARVIPMLAAQPGLSDQGLALVKMSRDGAGFASQSLPRQAEALAAFKPGDPKQAQLRAHLETVHARQQASYKENPWQAAEQFARAQPSPPVQLSAIEQIPQLVAERLKSIGQVETLAGGVVSPIRPEEVQQVQTLLAAQPVERRAEVLAQVGTLLPPERIAKLAEQLDKGDRPTALMLLAGADRTSAGRSVSVLIGRGAQAIKDKSVKRDDAALTGWRTELAGLIRGSLGDDRAEQAAIDAAYFVRAAMDMDGYEFKGASNKQAASLVVGHILQRDGQKTTLPRGMTEDQFDEKLTGYSADRLKAIAPKFRIGGREVTPEWLAPRLSSMGMRRDSRGRYVPFLNGAAVTLDGETPLFLEVR